LTFNESKGNVLPNSTRKFENKWDAKPVNFLDVPIGRFKANLNVVYGEGNKTLTSTLVFWILPWWVIITALIVVLIIILVIILAFVKRLRKTGGRPTR
jgi:hypothetical protein